jgi:hypothetical protein
MERYRHTEFGLLMTAGFLVGIAACGYLVLHSADWIPTLAMVILLVLTALFSTLTTSVGDGFFEVWFGSGLIRRRIALTDIDGVDVVENAWYYGWGIHWTPEGWLWNVAGTRGIELQFRDGRRFRVGSDEPERLAAAIRAEIGLAEQRL